MVSGLKQNEKSKLKIFIMVLMILKLESSMHLFLIAFFQCNNDILLFSTSINIQFYFITWTTTTN